MAGFIGHLNPFDESVEPWETYVERFEFFITANGIEDEKKVAVFLSVIGASTYGLLRSLVAPDKPGAKTYAELVKVLKDHFSPKPIVIAERFRFHKRNQQEGESVTQYIAVIKQLSEHCEFGTHLQDALRDRLVCGLNVESIQRKLLNEAELTFKKAAELAVSMETVARETHQLSNALKVNALSLDSSKQRTKCPRCGKTNHQESECFYKEQKCHNCGKRGHISKMCRSKETVSNDKSAKYKVRKKNRVHRLDVNEMSSSDCSTTDTELSLHMVSQQGNLSHISVRPKIEGKIIEMELDTGAAVSLISKELYDAHFSTLPLRQTHIMLKTYTGELIPAEGVITVSVRMNKQRAKLPLYVVRESAPPLFGREWLRKIRIDWREIKTVREEKLEGVLQKHAEVFKKELGTLKGTEVAIALKPDHVPRFCQARVVPYALRPKVEAEIDRLCEQGIISPVKFSEWATPIVPVVKKNGDVRICGDFKVTVNPALCVEKYPIPRIEDLFASLSGGQHFSKLDLSHAYLQMVMEEKSRKFLTITTSKGLFCYNRLAFGITSAPAIFQRAMDQVLQGLPNVHCYLDDILVSGQDRAQHLKNLDAVLTRLEEFGLRVQKEKCEFFKESLEYLGHVIDAQGLHKSPEKVRAIVEAPAPTDVSQLRSFLGLINYYSRFIPNLSSILSPLNALLCKGKQWQWTSECAASFKEAKEQLLSQSVLIHYDPQLPIRLACDASPYGVGSVISHILPNGQERPIAFASRTLNKAERNYAQIEREALGIIFGVRKFHHYLYGRQFTLLTDHRPLTTILSPCKSTPSMAAARMQRWALLLAAHHYTIQYREAARHGNADGLSRLPLPTSQREKSNAVDCFHVKQIEALPVNCREICRGSRRDPVLAQVMEMVSTGRFPEVKNGTSTLAPFINRKDELTLQQGCLMWGIRVIIPPKLRPQLLSELHTGHPGVVRMKAVARSYMWWPGIDAQIEQVSKGCQPCKLTQKAPGPAPLHPWTWPASPWQRIHVDFAGPFQGQMFMVIVDAHSKWPEVHLMSSTTTTKTIQVLRGLFSRYGLPETLVSDNGPQFTSHEFDTFMKSNGVQHIRSAPFHPSTNGLAERFVQTFKQSLKRSTGTASIQHRLDAFLLMYRNTPHSTTKECPSMLFMHRKLRSRLDLLKPSVTAEVEKAQEKQCAYRGMHAKARSFKAGDPVLVRDYGGGEKKWTSGVVAAETGPVSYTVDVGTAQHWRRHTDQMLPRYAEFDTSADNGEAASSCIPAHLPVLENTAPDPAPDPATPTVPVSDPTPEPQVTPEGNTTPPAETGKRYPTRTIKQPDRYVP